MAVKKYKPTTPGQRNKVISAFTEITAKKPRIEETMFPASIMTMAIIELILRPAPVASPAQNDWAAIKTQRAIAGVKSKDEKRRNLNLRKIFRYGSHIWLRSWPNFEYSAPGNQVSMILMKQRIE